MTDATLKDIAEFFEFKNLSQFRAEWQSLSDKDKTDLKQGIGDGSFNY